MVAWESPHAPFFAGFICSPSTVRRLKSSVHPTAQGDNFVLHQSEDGRTAFTIGAFFRVLTGEPIRTRYEKP